MSSEGLKFLIPQPPYSPLTDAQVKIFCNSNNYKANTVAREMQALYEPKDYLNISTENKFKNNIEAYPNPTNDKTSFRYQLEEVAGVKIYISNLFGEMVLNVVDTYHEKGNYEVVAPTHTLPAGIYLYTLETEQYKITKRLVVVK